MGAQGSTLNGPAGAYASPQTAPAGQVHDGTSRAAQYAAPEARARIAPPEDGPPAVGRDAYLNQLMRMLAPHCPSRGIDAARAVATPASFFAHNSALICKQFQAISPVVGTLSFDACASIIALIDCSTHALAEADVQVYAAVPPPTARDMARKRLLLQHPLLCYCTPQAVPKLNPEELYCLAKITIRAGARACILPCAPWARFAAILPAGSLLGNVHHDARPVYNVDHEKVELVDSDVDSSALTPYIAEAIAPRGGLPELLCARMRSLAIIAAAFDPENVSLTVAGGAPSYFLHPEALKEAITAATAGAQDPVAAHVAWLKEWETKSRAQVRSSIAAVHCLGAGIPIFAPAARAAVVWYFGDAPNIARALNEALDAAAEAAILANPDPYAADTYTALGTLVGQAIAGEDMQGAVASVRLLRTFIDAAVETSTSRAYVAGMGPFAMFVADATDGSLLRGVPADRIWVVHSRAARILQDVLETARSMEYAAAARAIENEAPAAPDAPSGAALEMQDALALRTPPEDRVRNMARAAWESAATDAVRLCTTLKFPGSLIAAGAFAQEPAQCAITLLLVAETLSRLVMLKHAGEFTARADIERALQAAGTARAQAVLNVAAASAAWLSAATKALNDTAAALRESHGERGAPRPAEMSGAWIVEPQLMIEAALRLIKNLPRAFSDADFEPACAALLAWRSAADKAPGASSVDKLKEAMSAFAAAYRICLPCADALNVGMKKLDCAARDASGDMRLMADASQSF